MVIMLILFMNFYIHEYVTRSNDAKRRKQRLEQSKKLDGDQIHKKTDGRVNGLHKTKTN